MKPWIEQVKCCLCGNEHFLSDLTVIAKIQKQIIFRTQCQKATFKIQFININWGNQMRSVVAWFSRNLNGLFLGKYFVVFNNTFLKKYSGICRFALQTLLKTVEKITLHWKVNFNLDTLVFLELHGITHVLSVDCEIIVLCGKYLRI